MPDKEIYDIQSLKDQLVKDICAQLQSMIQSPQGGPTTEPPHDYIASNGSVPCCQEGGIEMAVKYRQRVRIGSDADGKPIYRWVSGNTQDELNQNIADALRPTSRPGNADSPLWSEYAVKWFDSFKAPTLKEKTSRTQRLMMMKHVVPAFGNKLVSEITAFDVMDALNARKDYRQSYLRDIKSMMKQIFCSALEDGFISQNPMDSKRVKNPSKNRAIERKPLTPSEQADIIKHIPDLANESDRRFMGLLMFTSMRPSEIFGLRWENVDMKNGLIKIDQAVTFIGGKGIVGETKTDESVRVIPMAPQLAEFLKPVKSSGYVVCRLARGHSGEHYTEQAMRRAWERIKNQIDVHGMTPYVGRHTFATNMSKAGISMKTAMALMGHTDERMLMRHYIHTDMDDIRNAGKVMAGFIGQSENPSDPPAAV